MAPPIECNLGYRFQTLNTNLNPNPKTDPDPNPNPNPNPNPKSNNNVCSAKRHANKVQDSVINISYFRWAEGGYIKGLYRKVVANANHQFISDDD